jgi:hypothetical protein
MSWNNDRLKAATTPDARAELSQGAGWRLSIPAGPAGHYRLAQIDDYSELRRRSFPWNAPFQLSLRARASAAVIPGTWGFGLWNDPFGMGILSKVGGARLPVLPNAAWFFFASPANHLSLRDDLQAQGALAATFRSRNWPAALLALGAPGLALLAIPATARILRRLMRRFVGQDATALQLDPTEWHEYCLEWRQEAVDFQVDGQLVFHTEIAPVGSLGLVIWIDNQYAAFPADGRLRYGMLANPEETWIEVQECPNQIGARVA